MQYIVKFHNFLIIISIIISSVFIFTPFIINAHTDCQLSCSNEIAGMSIDYTCTDGSLGFHTDIYDIYNGICTNSPLPSGTCLNTYSQYIECDNGAVEYYPLHKRYWIGSGCPGSEICQCSKLEKDWCPIEQCIADGGVCVDNSDCCNDNCAGNICGGITPQCGIRNLNCPTTCTIGQNFTISYEARNLFNPYTNYLFRRVEGYKSGAWSSLFCSGNEAIPWGAEWITETKTFSCSNIGASTQNIRVGAHSSGNPSLYYYYMCMLGCPWCSALWEEANVDCSATCTVMPVAPLPSAVGYVRVMTTTGILELRLISKNDAISAGRGLLKVARFAGDTNSAADLVLNTDINASPVKIKTSFGIFHWRKKF